jgi:hypothetical protein
MYHFFPQSLVFFVLCSIALQELLHGMKMKGRAIRKILPA